LNSTRVRVPVVGEFRLRRLMVAVPLPAPKRLFSPMTAPDEGMVLMNWTIEGEPRRSSSCEFTTSTGRAAFSGVPAMNEPVTTTSLTSPAGLAAWAAAVSVTPREMATASTELAQKYLAFICSSPSRGPSVRPMVKARD
jgi:hypothetical protein